MSIVARLSNLFRGFAAMLIGDLEKKSPAALLERERENLRVQVGKYNASLAAHAGNSERLRMQLTKQEALERKAKAKIEQSLQAGDREPAGELAVRHQALTEEIAGLRGELATAEETYASLTKARDLLVAQAKQKLADVSQGLGDLKVKRANAEINEMAASSVAEIGGGGDTMNRLEEIVTEQRDRSAGRVRAARDKLAGVGIEPAPVDQASSHESALADFAAQEGIPIAPAPPTSATPAAKPPATRGVRTPPETPTSTEPSATADGPKPAPGSGKSMGPRQAS